MIVNLFYCSNSLQYWQSFFLNFFTKNRISLPLNKLLTTTLKERDRNTFKLVASLSASKKFKEFRQCTCHRNKTTWQWINENIETRMSKSNTHLDFERVFTFDQSLDPTWRQQTRSLPSAMYINSSFLHCNIAEKWKIQQKLCKTSSCHMNRKQFLERVILDRPTSPRC